MKRRILCVNCVLCVMLSGCTNPIPQPFIESSYQFANVTVGPEYEKYVLGDAALSDSGKQVRLDNLRIQQRMTNEYRKQTFP